MKAPARWLVAPLVLGPLVASLTACRHDQVGSPPATASSPVVATAGATPAGLSSSAAVAPGSDAAAPSAALARVSADLSGIDAAASQADGDLGAGDAARSQPDDGN